MMKFCKSTFEDHFQCSLDDDMGGLTVSFNAIEVCKEYPCSAKLFNKQEYRGTISVNRPDTFWPMVKEMGIPVVYVSSSHARDGRQLGDAA